MKRGGVRVTSQRKSWDCGVACLAMLLSRPYGDVSAIVREAVDPQKAKRRGLIIGDMVFVALMFGADLEARRRKAGYLDGQTGILGVIGGGMDRAGHWVVLKAGVIIDPDDGKVWTVADYMAHHKSRPTTLLVEAA